jgi:acyl-coenzyme A thioesterase PaaI-like protein
MRRLVEALRELVRLTHTSAAPAEVVGAAASDLATVAGRLAEHLDDDPVTHSMATGGSGEAGIEHLGSHMPFDVVIGDFNPLALPVEISSEGEMAVGHARFTLPYEGPPGCVHGAVMAATFDIVLTVANLLAKAAGPTVNLSVSYLRPTLLHEDVRFEAEVHRREGRRTFSRGRAVQGGLVTVEAQGEFVALDRDATRDLGARRPPA